MTTCVAGTCGVGGSSNPQPGDPDNNITLSANTTYGGIKVSWSYPVVNPHAVAYTVIYRGLTSNFSDAVELVVAAGSVYFDQLNPVTNTTYYYWVKLVSVNGTVADHIGPASAIARPRYVETLESLTERIDSGVLAQSLKTEIDKITLNYGELVQEIADRVSNDAALSAALADVQAGVTDALAFVNNEITSRIDGQSALASEVNLVVGINDANAAAIIAETTARVSADSALASQITTVAAASADAAAAVVTETTARTSADAALSSQITTAQTTLNGDISSVQTSMQTQINAVTGELDAIYTAKVGVNGLVGGFGIYGTATEVQAGFDVDLFWVGRTGPDKVKPFIISGGVVYMDAARIRDADITTLKVAGAAITGLSTAIGGAATIPGSSGVLLVAAAVTMPAGGSGVLVTVSVSLSSTVNSTQQMVIKKGTTIVAVTSISLFGGFATTETFTWVDTSPTTGSSTYSFEMHNPSSGPGSGVAGYVTASSIVVSGAKR